MQRTAQQQGLTPQQLADHTAAQFARMGEALNARADDIVRTTQDRHKQAVMEIWRRMEANGDLYLSKYSGWYSVRDEAYYDEGELTEREGKNLRQQARLWSGLRRRVGFSVCLITQKNSLRIMLPILSLLALNITKMRLSLL